MSYHDQVGLGTDLLEQSTLEIRLIAKLKNGESKDLPTVRVPKKLTDNFCQFQDIDRLKKIIKINR